VHERKGEKGGGEISDGHRVKVTDSLTDAEPLCFGGSAEGRRSVFLDIASYSHLYADDLTGLIARKIQGPQQPKLTRVDTILQSHIP